MTSDAYDPKITPATPSEPVHAFVIGTGTGDGGPTKQLIETPEGQRNVLVSYITPLGALIVSFLYMFLNSFVTTLSAGGMTDIIQFATFAELAQKAGVVALIAALLNLAKDLLLIFTALKQKYPILGAS